MKYLSIFASSISFLCYSFTLNSTPVDDIGEGFRLGSQGAQIHELAQALTPPNYLGMQNEVTRLQQELSIYKEKEKIKLCNDGKYTKHINGCRKHGRIMPINLCGDGTYNHDTSVDACILHNGIKYKL